MKLQTALLAATGLAALVIGQPVLAQTPPVTGIYVGGGLGYNILQNEKAKANATLGNQDTTIKFGGGLVGVASVGYGFGNGLRVELQGDYYHNNINNSSAGTFVSGKEQKYGVMVNALYDFNFGLPVVPYLGAGVGYQWVNWQGVTLSGGTIPGAIGVNSTQGSFAYQGIAGIAYDVPQMPGFALTAEYRLMGLVNARKFSASEDGVGSKLKVENGFNNSFLVGVRYNFGVAPPPPPAPAPVAAPAPAPARTYLVFFDWDRYNLTDRAKEIIAEAAQNSTKVQYTKIQVNGYTDTSGTPHYNMGLSIRRANAVKAQLITDGVPANVISIEGFGETHLLVPTGPGVREPQNRRVEIIIE